MIDFDLSVIMRLVLAAAAGIALGLPRDLADKAIGMRTLGLVSLAAAMITIGTLHYPLLKDDPNAISRVLQGIIQGLTVGVGFIGAGVIMRTEKKRVHGLTTATTVLVAAALGISCGIASWTVAVVGFVLAVLILVVLKRFETHVADSDEVERH